MKQSVFFKMFFLLALTGALNQSIHTAPLNSTQAIMACAATRIPVGYFAQTTNHVKTRALLDALTYALRLAEHTIMIASSNKDTMLCPSWYWVGHDSAFLVILLDKAFCSADNADTMTQQFDAYHLPLLTLESAISISRALIKQHADGIVIDQKQERINAIALDTLLAILNTYVRELDAISQADLQTDISTHNVRLKNALLRNILPDVIYLYEAYHKIKAVHSSAQAYQENQLAEKEAQRIAQELAQQQAQNLQPEQTEVAQPEQPTHVATEIRREEPVANRLHPEEALDLDSHTVTTEEYESDSDSDSDIDEAAWQALAKTITTEIERPQTTEWQPTPGNFCLSKEIQRIKIDNIKQKKEALKTLNLDQTKNYSTEELDQVFEQLYQNSTTDIEHKSLKDARVCLRIIADCERTA